jgi:hypothetical protein
MNEKPETRFEIVAAMTVRITVIGVVTSCNLVRVLNLDMFNICHTTRLTSQKTVIFDK